MRLFFSDGQVAKDHAQKAGREHFCVYCRGAWPQTGPVLSRTIAGLQFWARASVDRHDLPDLEPGTIQKILLIKS
jgi:hypothetical protein